MSCSTDWVRRGYLRVEVRVVWLELGVHRRKQLLRRFSRPFDRPDRRRVGGVYGDCRAPHVCVAIDVGNPLAGPLALVSEVVAERLVAVCEVLRDLRQLEPFEQPAFRRVLCQSRLL